MKILAIDTTTKFLTLAIYDNGRVCEYNLEVGIKLASLLAPTIKRVLEAAGLTIGAIDYFACGLGPGSFTGIRVGLSTIKGFGLALHKPIIGVPTLDILAMNAPMGDKIIIPVIDAKRSLIYSCAYKYKKGKLSKVVPYALITKEELYKKIKSPSIVFGDALILYREDIIRLQSQAPYGGPAVAKRRRVALGGVSFLDKDCWYPKAHNIITLALDKIRQGRADKNFKINPIYLYPKECQISRR
ncbi:MAG: tRNA (adenosine(37)-N6)-threonylcarbamoyltransferase complex dimerization subunit type 1 TsaB [Candidatus Omnitrophica bacterium CG08_land_8_20_14_0_20_41_16]|uniref:tRNA (Adenosine(37)-N6)-threonylcarbamoyltransferase complex dimerization subunit type 1 TsaB n=1 Tax=Candidatus Sherwoodlollariibacterium unditelluris TaxID=1974757 RepID=A0A2G9YJD2_9BACT|nr:MAG: tRNA (adenosine(37)-N6)-threonylcarbamoyltransferase complex dimerization subunit type 1 TsaB [Candidatus Omnitrophica bacterium CG23_combo_of_CG06-09_8_20_14_all_41_10]PIS34395.1 MAG: tRNA (adenosine(37)-N6)-threonylcarbamoyltransferase complex dimerization subunit type 1 TsaB [Candidatus Omnitrophica bacterium CG08_land_8_20_14_0_20_41_16]